MYGHAGMEVVVWSPNMTAERAAEAGVRFVSLEELLSTSKVVTLHLGYGPTTHGLINAERLALMKPDSVRSLISYSIRRSVSSLQITLHVSTPVFL